MASRSYLAWLGKRESKAPPRRGPMVPGDEQVEKKKAEEVTAAPAPSGDPEKPRARLKWVTNRMDSLPAAPLPTPKQPVRPQNRGIYRERKSEEDKAESKPVEKKKKLTWRQDKHPAVEKSSSSSLLAPSFMARKRPRSPLVPKDTEGGGEPKDSPAAAIIAEFSAKYRKRPRADDEAAKPVQVDGESPSPEDVAVSLAITGPTDAAPPAEALAALDKEYQSLLASMPVPSPSLTDAASEVQEDARRPRAKQLKSAFAGGDFGFWSAVDRFSELD